MDRNKMTFSSSDSDDEFAMIVIGILPKERVYRNRYDPLVEYDDADFVRRFRLSKDSFSEVLFSIRDQILHKTSRSYALPPHLQLLITLRFYTTGAFQAVFGDHIHHVHKSTVCRTVKCVSRAIASMRPNYIKMPNTTQDIITASTM
ncbi:PREDICTED: uncharacterized protein LOC107173208 [Diuraphis noxia]|uniref:uncharacterized protein LOC107173208 n=1 Tax=Diuraphis noxia TaxID=143948 RepID=UPI0007635A56|nr:PREDICTED: uncharacterized protein LOC107173208 [Diuraphis noxia]